MAGHAVKEIKKAQSTTKEFLVFISIPLAVALLVAALVIGPSLFAKPKYDFIYSYCPEFSCSNDFYVNSDGQLVETPIVSATYGTYAIPELYYYSEASNSSKRIDLASARTYKLGDSSNVSPDGYSLVQGNTSDGGFLFWSSSDYNWYLKNGIKKKRVNLVNSYGNDIKILGWVQ